MMTAPDSIDFKSLKKRASEITDLENFGNPDHLKGLEGLCYSLQEEAKLNDVGKIAQHSRIVGILVNRLRFEKELESYPEIKDESILGPIVIVGLPRTGSTMMHRLLSSDSRNTSMIWWEGRNPSRFPSEERGKPLKRIKAGKNEVQELLQASPDLMSIHPMDAMAPDEEILLLEHTFYSTVPESFMYVPSYSKWIEEQNHTTAYEYLKSLLKYLQWQSPNRSKKTWVLKTPHHMGYVDIILKVFPNAKVIQTHRSPIDTIPSYCSMVTTLAAPLSNQLDPKLIGMYWEKKLSRVMLHCMNIANQNPSNFLDINYLDLIKNPLQQVRKVYNFLNIELNQKIIAEMEKWIQENQQHKHGHHEYSSSNYGLDDQIIKEDFSEYINTYIKRV